jgi:branched-chain amino acid transport system permease protein
MNYWLGVSIITAIFMIAILGVSILTGFTGLFSLGHAGFMAIGAYVSGIVTKTFNLPIGVGLLCAMAGSLLIGLLIGRPTLKLKGDYFIIATLGIGEAINLIAQNWVSVTGGPYGLTEVPSLTGMKAFYIVWGIAVMVIIFCSRFIRSKHGRNLIAIREDEIAAETVGINIYKYKMLSFGISCVLCGLAGALLGHYMKYVHPSMFSAMRSNELVINVILGGSGSLTGSIIASCILVPLPEFLRFGSAQEWRLVFYGLAVVLVILFRPTGLMGHRELEINDIKNFTRAIVHLGGKNKNEKTRKDVGNN